METRSILQRILDPVRRLAQKQGSVRDEEGSAIVEIAMSIILLLTFIFGVMEAASALYVFHFISEAAREGARYAIVRGSNAGTACGTSYNSYDCIASSGNVQSYVQNLGFVDPNNMTVTTTWSVYTKGNSCPASPSPCNSPGNLVTVQVQYNFPLNVPFLPPKTYAMSSTASMIIQN